MKNQVLSELANKVAINGLKEIHTAENKAIKYLWIFILVGGTLLTGFYCYRVISEYMENGTATKVIGGNSPAKETCSLIALAVPS
jgi:hypothetical protein